MKIEVLEMSCCGSSNLLDAAKKAAEELGINAEIVKVEDLKEILKYGVMAPPALVVDGVVKVSGRSPKKDEIKKWLRK